MIENGYLGVCCWHFSGNADDMCEGTDKGCKVSQSESTNFTSNLRISTNKVCFCGSFCCHVFCTSFWWFSNSWRSAGFDA